MRKRLLTDPARKVVALLLCAVTTGILGCAQAMLGPDALAGSEYYNAYAEGVQAAETRGDEIIYGAAACATGLPVGIAVALYGASAAANPPPMLLVGKSEEYVRGFSAGFEGRVHQKRVMAGAVGVGIGVAAGIVYAVFLILSLGRVY